MNETAQPADKLYLCLDQGGHASRAVIVDQRGTLLSAAKRTIGTQKSDSRVEHDAEELVASLQQSAAECIAAIPEDRRLMLVSAGLATQRSSIVCWDRTDGRALSPVISWQDTRAAEELLQFAGHWDTVHRITGLVLSPHYGASKLRWCLRELPAVRAAADAGTLCFGPLAGFLAARLTNNLPGCADPANAARTLLWDCVSGDWSPELLAMFGIPANCLPECVFSQADWGQLSVPGLAVSLPLRVVTGDQSAALFAFGRPDPQVIYANLGTGAFLQRSLETASADSGRLLRSAVYRDSRQIIDVLEGTVNGSGSALSHMADDRGISIDELHRCSAEWLETVRDPPLYLNSVAGLGSPWWQSDMEARLEAAADTPAAIAAVLESIVFLLTVNLEIMQRITGKANALVVTGGLGVVDPLLQRLADLSRLPVLRSAVSEGTARGLAYLLAGLPADWPQPQVNAEFRPGDDAAVRKRYQRWCEAMPPLPQGVLRPRDDTG